MIIAGGDSFVYGSELKDCNNSYSQSTFTALLASDSQYYCVAWPGYANDSISRTVISQCELFKSQHKAVIVSWTFPGRYEFRFNYDTEQRTGNWYSITPWTIEDSADKISQEFIAQDNDILNKHLRHVNRAKKTGVYDFAKTFYMHVGSSEYWEIYSSLKEIVYLQNYLRCNNIPYMFTCASADLFNNYTVENKDSIIKSLYNQIDFNKWFFFPSTTDRKGFWQWAVDNKYPMGTTHPLEQAHAAAAELMKEKFNELVKKNLE